MVAQVSSSTEKTLLWDKELEKAYSKVIDDYKEKGYISKVNESDTKEKMVPTSLSSYKTSKRYTKVRAYLIHPLKKMVCQ